MKSLFLLFSFLDCTKEVTQSPLHVQTVKCVFPENGYWRVIDASTPVSGRTPVQNVHAHLLTDRICVRTCEGITGNTDAATNLVTRILKMMKMVAASNDVIAHACTNAVLKLCRFLFTYIFAYLYNSKY